MEERQGRGLNDVKASAMNLELCVDSVESAVAAELGGATRIELCSALREGGLTPSSGLIRAVRARVSFGVHVMVRPRSGDFCFSDDEFSIMRNDILYARECGADGVVIGLLTPSGDVDVERTRELVELAQPMEVTFHRAIDLSRDILRSLEDVISAGVDRVLTSGGEPDALAGGNRVREMVRAAGGRVAVMVGGGVRAENARLIAEASGARDFHSGFARVVNSAIRHQVHHVHLGDPDIDDYLFRVVLREDVHELRAVLEEALANAKMQ